MSLLNSVLKMFVGDKQQKDLKLLQPIVEKTNAFETAIGNLSNDELRAKSTEFKSKIKDATNSFETKISELEKEAASADIDRQEAIYSEIDTLKDQAYEASEAVLLEIMPEAFAVVKETAKRFTNNTQIEVTATPFDRELSAIREHVALVGDKSVWANSWDASGQKVTWDMIHYDVQLIGGSVLHQGKIEESGVLAIKGKVENKMEQKHDIINLGTGIGVTVLEAIKAFEKVSGSDLNYEIGQRREGDVAAIYANNEKAKLEHLKTKTQLQLAKEGIKLKISKIRTEIKSSDADITSLEKELKLADEIYKNYEGRYIEKLSSMSDVIIKQSEQIQKILELQMAHNKRNERIFALEKIANGEEK